MTTPTSPLLPEPLKVVAYLVTSLRSGEPSLCFEDERGDYGDQPAVFEDMVLRSEAEAALNALRAEVAALRVDGERYRWLTQCKRVPWGAFLENAHEVGIDAAIDASREALQPGEEKR